MIRSQVIDLAEIKNLKVLKCSTLSLNYIILMLLFLSCNKPQDIDSYLMKLHQNGKLNGNVLVINNDTVVYEKSFGTVDGANKDPLTSAHYFALGSIQKEFPGVAIMQLKEEGLLSLEDRLSRFLPYLPPWANKITIRNLLQYSSGLPHVDWNLYFDQGVANQEKIIEDLSAVKELEFTPGTDYLYSYYNPLVLQRVVERLTGMSFKEYVEKQIIIPYKLDGLIVKEEYPYKNATMMAIPFNKKLEADNYHAEVFTVCSSTKGMYNWFRKLDNFEIISKESMKELSREVMEKEYVQSPLGQCDWKGDDINLHFHHGNSQNYESLVRNYKQDQLLIVLLTNQDNENLYDIADTIYEITKRDFLRDNT